MLFAWVPKPGKRFIRYLRGFLSLGGDSYVICVGSYAWEAISYLRGFLSLGSDL